MAGQIEEGSAGNHKSEEGGQIHFALVEVRQCGIVRDQAKKCGKRCWEGERAFAEDRKERESFTAVDGCDVLQAGRPPRLELESTNER
jgi:hypothetical protein